MTGQVLRALQGRSLELGPTAARPSYSGKHWQLRQGEDRVAWLLLDQEDASANTLSEGVLTELDEILAQLETEPPAGLVLRSAKKAGFIAGANIAEFRGLTDRSEIEARLQKANAVVDRLEALETPTVAVLHGYCLGGGLELALACEWRIAVGGVKLGFPEVRLGLHPGLGGTARATARIDPVDAMTMMLTGKSVDAEKALSLGLINAVTEERHLRHAVSAALQGELDRGGHGVLDTAFKALPVRKAAASRMSSKAEEKAPRANYPAPHALIGLWEAHGGSTSQMKRAEIPSFSQLLVGETAQNLIRAFFLREKLKKLVPDTENFQQVHVIGAGAMGGDIAAWCALQGLRVTLADTSNDAIAGALERTGSLCQKRHMSGAETLAVFDRLIPDPQGFGVSHAEVLIEAVPEDQTLKQGIYKSVEPQMKESAILATNTSSIPLEELKSCLKRPERFLGLHFFNPVPQMQLVEVVRQDDVDNGAFETALAFVGRIDRLPVPVKSAPGFLVNRALTPYLLEAVAMVDEGIKPETIDRAAERFGMPMGPVELADRVGLDVCVNVAETLADRVEAKLPKIPDWLSQMIATGDLGRKSGKGFYLWKDGQPKKAGIFDNPDDQMIDRLVLPLLDACVACLRQGVVKDEELLDGAMIFATGFAPFRGGPMHFLRSRGAADLRALMKDLSGSLGDRFLPDRGWKDLS